MAMFKSRLGKGLDALLPEDDADEALPQAILGASEIEKKIPLERIHANPNQPRKNFDETALNELASSIKMHGLIQPVILEEDSEGGYTIIAGERRTRAARIAGLTEIPALIRVYNEKQKMMVTLIENIQRENLNPIEEALAYQELIDEGGLSQEEAAEQVGKNRATVANTLRLLKLPKEIRDSLSLGKISPGHGRAILSLEDEAKQKILFDEIIVKGLSVRAAETRAVELSSKEQVVSSKEPKQVVRDPELVDIEQKFIEKLGTKVAIKGNMDKGVINIDYYSMDDLDRLYEILTANHANHANLP
ncbi:MAG: ParB/RepB/Spo0J family partition protein [Spirochaetaceae bacterium]|jgi:ParB family chromosome partitioning protein|nr:ParB/RepB/Spo0J family partition protein [Spirochaetaceae bacterium]